MSYSRTVNLKNGDSTTPCNYYNCDVTGEEFFEADPHLSYNNFHLSEKGIEVIIEDYLTGFNYRYACGTPIFLHRLIEMLCVRNKRSCYISKEMKASVLKKYKHKCNICGSTEKLEFDHIKPVSKGGLTELKNLQILCKPCNVRKSNKYENKNG